MSYYIIINKLNSSNSFILIFSTKNIYSYNNKYANIKITIIYKIKYFYIFAVLNANIFKKKLQNYNKKQLR